MAGPFDSAWLKWGWAVIEAEALKDDIDVFTEHLRGQGLGRTRCDYQSTYHRFAVVLDQLTIPDFPQKWGLRLGNIVHNYRSCLDHLAWALVERGSTPPSTLTEWRQRSVIFPIHGDRKKFRDGLQRQLPGARRADIAKVRACQPYNFERKRNAATAALTILERLSRFDKHRTIQPVAAYPFGGSLEVTYARDCEVSRPTRNNPRNQLEVGAEFAYVYVRKTGPKPEMSVKADLSVKPSIDNGFWLNEWLYNVKGVLANLLGEFAQPPKKLIERLERPT